MAATNEGVNRSVRFWKDAFPIYLQYRFVEEKLKLRARLFGENEEYADSTWNELHDRFAPDVEHLVLDLRGFYLKQAQLMSILDPDFIPTQYMDFCRRCQDQGSFLSSLSLFCDFLSSRTFSVPSEITRAQIDQRISEEFPGETVESLFDDFDYTPVGSASIGQVHRAVWKKTNQVVAVKIQAINIEARFRADLKCIYDFCAMSQPQHLPALLEIEKQFLTEFDYRGEAENLQTVSDNLQKSEFSKRFQVPLPIAATKKVLVMEFLDGTTLIDGIKQSFKRYADFAGKSFEEMEREETEKMNDPNFVMADVLEEQKRMRHVKTLVRTTDAVKNAAKFAFNWSPLALVSGRYEYAHTPELLNLAEIIYELANVHAHEILVDGAFNGDPHPGNVMLLENGKIGLIDYGQFKRIDRATRIAYARIIVALANDDEMEVVRMYRELGVKTKKNRADVIYKLAAFYNDRNTADITGGRNLQKFIEWAEAEDPADELPRAFCLR